MKFGLGKDELQLKVVCFEKSSKSKCLLEITAKWTP